MNRIILGVGGFIGSGKSTVAHAFEELGAHWIDADAVVNVLYQPEHEGFKRISDFFGEEFLSPKGLLNRKKLAKVVFEDPQKLKILNALVHPLVTTEVQKLIDKSKASFIALEATYFERKFLKKLIHALAWVETEKDLSFERISKSRNMERELFERIRRLQLRPETVEFTVDNNGSVENLKSQVRKIFESLKVEN